MRRRIILAMVAVALAGIAVFGVPLAVVARRVVRDDELRRLDREADAVGFAIDDDVEAGNPVNAVIVRRVVGPERYVVVTDPQGRRTIVGKPIARRHITTVVHTSSQTTVRMDAPAERTDTRTLEAIAVVAGLGAVGVAVAVGLAVAVAGRLSRPLSSLADVSRRLGAGDFSARADSFGIAEADAVANALNATARRIEELLEAERAFSTNASHQLRTPLTAIRLHVEELANSADPDTRRDAEIALAEIDRLGHTIDELLEFARRGRIGQREELDISDLLHDHEDAWRRAASTSGRSFVVRINGPCRALVAPASLTQALDTLVDNALRHGTGEVTISARSHGRSAEIVVTDEGAGIPPGTEEQIFERHVSLQGGSGVGLSLARALIEADGGRLDLIRSTPPAFRILLPALA